MLLHRQECLCHKTKSCPHTLVARVKGESQSLQRNRSFLCPEAQMCPTSVNRSLYSTTVSAGARCQRKIAVEASPASARVVDVQPDARGQAQQNAAFARLQCRSALEGLGF